MQLILSMFIISTFSFAMPDCNQLKNRWYKVFLKQIDVAWDTKTFICPKGESIFALALYDLETVDMELSQSPEIPEFFKYATQTVSEFSYDEDCHKSLAYTLPEEKKVILCPPFFSNNREDRAATLVHEARHTHHDDPKHETCKRGYYAGKEGACDAVFYDDQIKGGGFNMDIYFYGKILSIKNRNELSAEAIQSTINYMIPDRFNSISAKAIKKWRK